MRKLALIVLILLVFPAGGAYPETSSIALDEDKEIKDELHWSLDLLRYTANNNRYNNPLRLPSSPVHLSPLVQSSQLAQSPIASSVYLPAGSTDLYTNPSASLLSLGLVHDVSVPLLYMDFFRWIVREQLIFRIDLSADQGSIQDMDGNNTGSFIVHRFSSAAGSYNGVLEIIADERHNNYQQQHIFLVNTSTGTIT